MQVMYIDRQVTYSDKAYLYNLIIGLISGGYLTQHTYVGRVNKPMTNNIRSTYDFNTFLESSGQGPFNHI